MLAAGLLLVVACAGNDDDTVLGTGADDYVQAAAESLSEDPSADAAVDHETAVCMVTAIVELVGIDELRAAEITPEELAALGTADELGVPLPDGATGVLADAFAGCGLAELLTEGMTGSLAGEPAGELPPEVTSCLAGTVDDRSVAAAWAEDFVDGSNAVPVLFADAVAGCPEAATAILLGFTSGPDSPEVEACVRSFVEAHPDVVRAWLADEAGASAELGRSLTDTCPGIPS